MNTRERFEQDLTALMSRLTIGVEKEVENKLNMLKDWLVNLQNGACLRQTPHSEGLRGAA
jgi:hypothetical protein